MFCVTCNKIIDDSLKNHIGHSVIEGDKNN